MKKLLSCFSCAILLVFLLSACAPKFSSERCGTYFSDENNITLVEVIADKVKCKISIIEDTPKKIKSEGYLFIRDGKTLYQEEIPGICPQLKLCWITDDSFELFFDYEEPISIGIFTKTTEN